MPKKATECNYCAYEINKGTPEERPCKNRAACGKNKSEIYCQVHINKIKREKIAPKKVQIRSPKKPLPIPHKRPVKIPKYKLQQVTKVAKKLPEQNLSIEEINPDCVQKSNKDKKGKNKEEELTLPENVKSVKQMVSFLESKGYGYEEFKNFVSGHPTFRWYMKPDSVVYIYQETGKKKGNPEYNITKKTVYVEPEIDPEYIRNINTGSSSRECKALIEYAAQKWFDSDKIIINATKNGERVYLRPLKLPKYVPRTNAKGHAEWMLLFENSRFYEDFP